MSQTEMLNQILSRQLRNGVAQHVSGCFDRQGQLWATSAHRMSYDNAKNLLTRNGEVSGEFADEVLETLVGSNVRDRTLFFFTVCEKERKLLISATFADTTAAGVIHTDGLALDIDGDGKIIALDVPKVKPIRNGEHGESYFVFYLPPIATVLAKGRLQ